MSEKRAVAFSICYSSFLRCFQSRNFKSTSSRAPGIPKQPAIRVLSRLISIEKSKKPLIMFTTISSKKPHRGGQNLHQDHHGQHSGSQDKQNRDGFHSGSFQILQAKTA